MALKKVKVEFTPTGAILDDEVYQEDGILSDIGLVLTVDAIGGVSIYKLTEVNSESVVTVSGDDLLSDNPQLFIDLILGGN
ncbi:hypothetical protein P9858_00790 [Niallia circulans]|uniref:hypothetical protein n=1 Tax=Niallia circulans TaxID=1397 RepID=UPI002E219B96|nr:hypothetical protein [Niallia circulans]